MCACMSFCTLHACKNPEKPEEGGGFPGVTDYREVLAWFPCKSRKQSVLLLWLARWPTWEDRACFGWLFTGHPEEGTRGRNLFMGGTTHNLLGHPTTIINQENVPTCLLIGQSDGSTSQLKFPLLRENPPAYALNLWVVSLYFTTDLSTDEPSVKTSVATRSYLIGQYRPRRHILFKFMHIKDLILINVLGGEMWRGD